MKSTENYQYCKKNLIYFTVQCQTQNEKCFFLIGSQTHFTNNIYQDVIFVPTLCRNFFVCEKKKHSGQLI